MLEMTWTFSPLLKYTPKAVDTKAATLLFTGPFEKHLTQTREPFQKEASEAAAEGPRGASWTGFDLSKNDVSNPSL
jgi:hypothetical protein